MCVTFALTVAVDLVVAIEVGMVLAAFLFMKRMSEVTNVQAVTREFSDARTGGDALASTEGVPRGVEVFEINGPFFFGAAKTFREQVESVLGRPRVLILRMRNVPAIDSTGMHALREVVRRSRAQGTMILLSDVHSQPMLALGRSRLLDELGDRAIFGSFDDALARARSHLGDVDPAADR